MVSICRECVNSRFNFDWRNSRCVLLDGQHDPKEMYGDEPPAYCPRQDWIYEEPEKEETDNDAE